MPADDQDRIRGALLGLAVGDALGAPLEAATPDEAARAVRRGLEMTGGRGWAPGEWTDDTAMALALAESIGARGLLDADDVAARYIDWATTDGKGIGWATAHALTGARGADDARARARAHLKATGLAAGNGAVMRATPIGLAARSVAEAAPPRRDAGAHPRRPGHRCGVRRSVCGAARGARRRRPAALGARAGCVRPRLGAAARPARARPRWYLRSMQLLRTTTTSAG